MLDDPPPTLAQAAEQFTVLDAPADRFEHLVRESCTCYADGMPTPDLAGPALTEMAPRYGLRLVSPPPG